MQKKQNAYHLDFRKLVKNDATEFIFNSHSRSPKKLKGLLLMFFYIFQFIILLSPAMASVPVLGKYKDTTTVQYAQNLKIIPKTTPQNASRIITYTHSSFTGLLTVDFQTGIVYVTNAKQAGNFTITVKAYNAADSFAEEKFVLKVLPSQCNNGNFIEQTVNNSIYTQYLTHAIGDFNGDGWQDIAMVSYDSKQKIAIRLGDSAGNFKTKTFAWLDELTDNVEMGVGDFNGDGNQDLAITRSDSSTVSIFLGDGTGSIIFASRVQVGDGPRAIVIADFNQDGLMDFATANIYENTISIRHGKGGGQFEETSELSVGSFPIALSLADFNNDNSIDLVTTNRSGKGFFSILLGDSKGSFYSSYDAALADLPYSLCIGDFNKDGKQDIAAVGRYNPGKIIIKLGDGKGGFTGNRIYSTGKNTVAIATADFNSDGYLDLATTSEDGVFLSFGMSNAQFQTAIRISSSSYLNGKISVGDFNNDGNVDMVITHGTSRGYFTLLMGSSNIQIFGNGTAIFSGDSMPNYGNFTRFKDGISSRTFTIKNAGINNLLLVDSAFSISGLDSSDFKIIRFPTQHIPKNQTDSFSVLFSPQNGHYSRKANIHLVYEDCQKNKRQFSFAIEAFPPAMLGNYPDITLENGQNIVIIPDQQPSHLLYTTATTDFRFKGKFEVDPDSGFLRITNAQPAGIYQVVVLATKINSQVLLDTFWLTVNDSKPGKGVLSCHSILPLKGIMTASAIGDFNKDGNQDMAIANYDSNCIHILLGNVEGIFKEATKINLINHPSSLVIGDYNEDGNLDLLPAWLNDDFFTIYFGDGHGGFVNGSKIFLNKSISLELADFNRDGRADLCGLNPNGSVEILSGLGNDGYNTFFNSDTVSLGGNSYSMAIADFNQDSIPDVVATFSDSSLAKIVIGEGNGKFTLSKRITVNKNPLLIATGDCFKDGFQDLIITYAKSDTLSVFPGKGDGSFGNPITTILKNYPSSFVLGDFNGDGMVDIATGSALRNSVSILIGDGNGHFVESDYQIIAIFPQSLNVGDFNQDGFQDLAVLGKDQVWLLYGGPSATKMMVEGNGKSISDESYTPRLDNFTEFGKNSLTKTYRILNTGKDDLILGQDAVSISGANASFFSVSAQPKNVISADSASDFTITYSPKDTGIHQANIHVSRNYCRLKSFNFAIKANNLPTANFNQELGNEFYIQVSPNPNKGLIQLKISGATHGALLLEITDIAGRLMYSQRESLDNAGMINISLPNMEDGTYFLKAIWNEHVYVHKLVFLR